MQTSLSLASILKWFWLREFINKDRLKVLSSGFKRFNLKRVVAHVVAQFVAQFTQEFEKFRDNL